MSRSRFVVAALVVGCSSGTSQAPPLQSPSPPDRQSSSETALSFGSCPNVEDAPSGPRSLRPPPVRRPAPGLFGTDGLEPRQTPQRGKTCQAARTTLDTTNDKILGAPKPAEASGVPRAWDRKTDPARWARVAQRYGLDQRHRAALARDGFVVAKGATHWGYVEAYHEVFQSQLPIYVSIDSVMHAIYASHDGVIGDVEAKVLLPRLRDLLSKMHCEMATVAASWPPDVARDVDLYLTVARALLTADRYSVLNKDKVSVASLLGNDDSVKLLVKKIIEAKGFEEIELFGRRRMVDFGAFEPRSRYANNEGYFRAMSWLSRIEMNLVSRSSRSSTMRPDTSETPREAAVALALLDLARATKTLDTIADIDHVWGELAGKREDVSFTELDKLRGQANLDGVSLAAQPALARAIGGGYQRSIPTQPHPDGLTDLPVITAMFGARVTPDTAAIAPIIQPAVPQRIAVGAADIGFLLGHARARHHLAKELAEHPRLDNQLVIARDELDARLAGDDLYSMWLRAIRALAKPTTGKLPTFMKSDGFADLRMSSAIAAFGQIRSSYELMGGMAYLGSGCEIPDGYVEPAAETYDALIAYADRGKALLAKIDPQDVSDAQTYFTRLGTTLRVLRAIVATELAGQPLTLAQKEWLSMVVEIVMRDGSGAPPTYAGWYFDLYRNFEDATKDPDFITGFAQSADTTMYVGAGDPRMGVFVVDTGGAPRVVVGPIAASYETTAPTTEGRLSVDNDYDETRPKPTRHEPWAQSYAVEDGTKPKITAQENWDDSNWFLDVGAMTNVGAITIRLLDHHRVPMAAQTKIIGPGRTRFRFPRSKADKAEMVQLQYGNFSQWSARHTGGESSFSFWTTTKAEYDAIEKFLEPKQQP